MSDVGKKAFHVGIFLIDGFALMSYASVVEPLRAANLLAGRSLYTIRHFTDSGDSAASSSGAQIEASNRLGMAYDFELVIVVAGGNPTSFKSPKTVDWLRKLAKRGVILAGVSGGPVILASAGLMQARRMTVHWEHRLALIEISPTLMVERSLYVIDKDRMTCAGGIAALDMMHALITQHHGAKFARQVSDWFMHTQVRASAGPQRAGLAERYGINSQPVILAIEMMENHVADALDLTQLGRLIDISPRQLNRLFREKLGQSTMGFYRNLRLEKARSLLTQSPLSVTEIALATGFSSGAHFSSAFHTRFGQSPSTLRV